MASTDARPIPQKNVAYRVTFPIFDADGDLVTGATGLDSEISKDGGTFTDCSNEATEIATASGMYFLDLTQTEMNADTVAIIVKTTTSGAKTTPIVLYPEEAGDIRVNVTQINSVNAVSAAGRHEVNVSHFGGNAGTFSGGRPEVNTSHAAGTAWGSGAITAGSIAASALNGKGDWNIGKTGYALSAAGVQAIWDALTSALTTANSIGKKLADWVIGTAQTGDAFARLGAPAGASVSADIAAVKSDTGAIKTKTDQLTFGTANRVNAQTYGMENGVVTANAIATNAIDADAIAADAVVEIQNGLATSGAVNNLTIAIAGIVPATGTIGDTGNDSTHIHLPNLGSYGDDELNGFQLVIYDNSAAEYHTRFIDDWDTTTNLATVATLPFSPEASVDLFWLLSAQEVTSEGGGTAPTVAEIADGVWDELLSGHLGAGSAGSALNGAGSAGDPWTTPLPGSYGAGTAGKIIGDNINTTISSRAPESGGNVAAIKTKTDQLTFTNANKLDAAILAANDFAQVAADKVWSATTRTLSAFGFTVSTNANATETAIKTQTDKFVFTTANKVDARAFTVDDKTGYSLTSGEHTSIAAAVWSATTRTLSSFGTLVADVAASVWGAASRTLTAFDFTVATDAPSVADIWSEPIPAAYDAGTAGFILGTSATGGGTHTGEYNSNLANTTDSDPGNNSLKWNTSGQIDASVLYVDNLAGGIDISAILSKLVAGSVFRIQRKNDADQNQIFQVTAASINGSGYWKVPVSLLTASGALFGGGQQIMATVILQGAEDPRIEQIETLVDELHKIQGLDAGNPMTVTPDSRVAGAIELEITGDGETSSTVTRQ